MRRAQFHTDRKLYPAYDPFHEGSIEQIQEDPEPGNTIEDDFTLGIDAGESGGWIVERRLHGGPGTMLVSEGESLEDYRRRMKRSQNGNS